MPNLANYQSCVGCSACALSCPKNCIEMQNDKYGFSHPKIINVQECINCKLCEQSCPVVNKRNPDDKDTIALAAFTKDEEIRKESSSGGIFTEIAKYVLLNNGVVFGAAYSNNWQVEHVEVKEVSNLNKLRGAKYSESKLGNTYDSIKQYLNKDILVLFSGTPCQVAGLKSFLKRDYSNLICIDFICHGIPSPVAWSNYIQERMKLDGVNHKPISINQRSKITGWSNYNYSCVIEYENNLKYQSLSGSDMYMKLFCNDYILRESCANCHFKGFDRCSDITLGDFWGIWNIDVKMDDNKGTSLIMLHSDKSKDLITKISDKIVLKEVSLDEASRENPAILYSSKEKSEREKVLDSICKGNFDITNELFKEVQPSMPLWKRVIKKIKNM